jgi:hypothetical protein
MHHPSGQPATTYHRAMRDLKTQIEALGGKAEMI